VSSTGSGALEDLPDAPKVKALREQLSQVRQLISTTRGGEGGVQVRGRTRVCVAEHSAQHGRHGADLMK
jgi:hypothetical protein